MYAHVFAGHWNLQLKLIISSMRWIFVPKTIAEKGDVVM
jgi:hypothetical protein